MTTLTETTIATITARIEEAAAEWTGRDWETDLTIARNEARTLATQAAHGPGEDSDEYARAMEEYEEAKRASREERLAIEADAERAAELGEEAVEALRDGDIDLAVAKLAEAAQMERHYGDAPAWGGLADMVRREALMAEAVSLIPARHTATDAARVAMQEELRTWRGPMPTAGDLADLVVAVLDDAADEHAANVAADA